MLSALVVLLLVTTRVYDVTASSRIFYPGLGEYVLNETRTTWTEAVQNCQSERNGNLAVIDSSAEYDVIAQLLRDNGDVTAVHLGFHDKFVPGLYTTVLGDELKVSCDHQWAAGYPTNDTAYNCGGFTEAGYINTDCDSEQAYICEYPLWSNYVYLPGFSHYKYHFMEYRTWTDAWQICHSEQAYLVVLNSQAEYSALFEKYKPPSTLWTGIHRALGNEYFVSVKGQPLSETGFDTWYSGYPTGDHVTSPYVGLFFNGGLYTPAATTIMQFICEHD